MYDRGLSEEQKMMRQSCRDFVDDMVLPYIKKNWQKEWSMVPEERLPLSILEGAEKVGIRTLGVPEEYGGVELEKGTEVRTFALVAEEIARGEFRACRQAGAELEGLGAVAPVRAQASSGALVQAPGRRAADS